MNQGRLIYRVHAVRRMFERDIKPDEVTEVLERGEVLEEYPTDRPFPSRLVLGVASNRLLHVVAADDVQGGITYVITVYEPDADLWTADGRRRK